MLVAVVVTSLVVVLMWNLFIGGSRSFTYGTWYSARTRELRDGLRMLREDLGKASVPSDITATAVNLTDTPPFHIGYKTGSPFNIRTNTGTVVLLNWFICKPSKNLPGEPAVAQTQIEAKLEARGRNLFYSKVQRAGSPPAEELYNKVLIEDVAEVTIGYTALDTAEAVGTLAIGVKCEHLQAPEKGANQSTTARLPVKVKTI